MQSSRELSFSFVLRMGDNDLNSDLDDQYIQTYLIEEHDSNWDVGLGIWKADAYVYFTQYINPVCLPTG